MAVGFAAAVHASAAPASAGTPTEAQLADAKKHYATASKFYDLAEYENALREFKEAYRAVEDPAFLFNIAQCHRKLGQTQDAISFYRTYLRRAPHAANRAEIERRIAELERSPTAAPPAAANGTSAEDTTVAPLVLDLPTPAPATNPRAEETLVASPAPAAPADTPFYRRGWFWIVTGVVVAGAATTIIVLSTRSDDPGPFCPDCAGTVVLP